MLSGVSFEFGIASTYQIKLTGSPCLNWVLPLTIEGTNSGAVKVVYGLVFSARINEFNSFIFCALALSNASCKVNSGKTIPPFLIYSKQSSGFFIMIIFFK